jgi:predicted alpha/beta hydrolase family esterase
VQHQSNTSLNIVHQRHDLWTTHGVLRVAAFGMDRHQCRSKSDMTIAAQNISEWPFATIRGTATIRSFFGAKQK